MDVITNINKSTFSAELFQKNTQPGVTDIEKITSYALLNIFDYTELTFHYQFLQNERA